MSTFISFLSQVVIFTSPNWLSIFNVLPEAGYVFEIFLSLKNSYLFFSFFSLSASCANNWTVASNNTIGKIFLNVLFICRSFCCFIFMDDHQLPAQQFRLQLQVLDHSFNYYISVNALASLFS